jgi:UV DNA damage repair endonuclease
MVKSHCVHADFIEPNDYPIRLPELSEKLRIDFRLDIEAKAKQKAIFKLENRD